MSENKKKGNKGQRFQLEKDTYDALSIEPSELIFMDTQIGKTYDMEINIRNKTTTIHQLKIYKPKYDQFQLDYQTQAESLSSGLSKKVKVRYTCTDNQDYFDKIKVVDLVKSYEIPLRAYAQKTRIKYQQNREEGTIALNTKQTIKQVFVNNGPSTKVKLIKDNFQNLFINPDEFYIEAGKSQTVQMAVIPTVAGTYKHRVLVQLNGTMGSPINIVYSAIEFRFYLTNEEGKKMTEFDFGQIYFGQKKVIKVMAVNNTPQSIDIKSKIRLGWKFNESALQSPQQLGVQCSSTIIDVEPKDCTMQAFSKQPLTLVCLYEVNKQIESKVANFAKRQEIGPNKFMDPASPELLQKYKINIYESHQTLVTQFKDKKIYCSLKVSCVHPLIKIQPSSLYFGDLPIKSTSMKKITIKNVRDNLSVKVSFAKSFSFEVIPSEVVIFPGQDKTFQVFLTPVSVGNFNCFISCITSNTCKIDIPVAYKSISQMKRGHSSLYIRSKDNQDLSLADITNLNKTMTKMRQRKTHHSVGKSLLSRAGNRKKNCLKSLCGELQKTQFNTSEDILALGKTKENNIMIQDNSQTEQKLIMSNRFYSIPKTKQSLFVTRKIDKYEPYKKMINKLRPQTRELNISCKKMPKCRKQFTALKRQLPVEALKNIQVTEKILNFGKVFVHSRIEKHFEIINNNDFHIQVKLTPNHDFLLQSDNHYQIMPGKTRCKFSVVLLPKQCGEFQSLVQYHINSVHCFKFLVQAQVELVTLNISKFNLKMSYQDEANDMSLSDSFDLTNEGNTEAYFSIDYNSQIFSIEPKNGVLTSGDKSKIMVVYKNENTQIIGAGQPKNIKDYNKPTTHVIDQRIIIKVKNGVDIFLRIQSNIFESKCYIKQSRINFGICIVPKSKTKTFILRNLSRSICLYEIDYSNCSNFLEFDSTKGKVLPESSKEVQVTYKSTNVHEVSTHFKVIIRGGPIITVPINAESIAPQISILEDQFNFGQICCGNVGALPIHIRNDSETAVELLLDLLNNHGTGSEYLDLSFDSEKEEKVWLCKNTIQHFVHKLKIEAKSTSIFMLLFQPKVPGFYEFQLPIYIENFIKNDNMAKTVSCFAKKPKFFLEPAIVKFKKKIINDKDNACFHPLVEFVTLKNPSDNVLKWKIEMPKQQGGKKLCFQIQNRRGEVKSKSWQCINIAFNPYQAGFYTYTFPVLIYSWERGEYIQEAEIKVEGEGQYPILLFDRRELILPVVPLQMQSVGMFKIINEGYETIDIKHRIYSMQDLNLIPEIVLFYPQGSKMGINKKQLYVIVKFVAKKPISFTVKLEIYDGCRIYDLPISGTSDNSLFTVFPYLSDKQNLYKLQPSPDGVNIRSIDSRNIIDKLHNQYEQISETDYQLTCEIIRRWINTLLRDEKVMRFPQDLVNSNENLLKFLSKLTSKKDFQKLGYEPESQQKFYQSVIRTLKSMGCLLNHIRPYYLLTQNQFQAIFEDPSLRHMANTYKKYYRIIHLQCWIILFYQVVSNFWYNPQKLKYSDYKSNVYTSTQITVLKWMKSIYFQYNEIDDPHKFVDYSKDFKDCFALIYSLYHYNYLNKTQQSLQGLNRRIVSLSDYYTNLRMLYTMMAKANLIPLISEDQFQYIKETQMFMLVYQLYESLPQQIPKTAPIIFACELGERCSKFIQVKNPSNKIVNYWVRVQGSQDYFLQEKQFIKIEPKSTYRLSVEFRSRVSQQQIAFLTLFNKKQLDNNSGIGCSLVFELRSQIVGRKSIKKLQSLKCPLYENTSIKIPVENQFNDKQYGNFKIIIVEQYVENKEQSKTFNFYVEIESVKIRRGTSSTIELFYNPMILKPIRCLLIFCDAAVGQFQYEIVGIPELPKPLQEIKVPNPIYINAVETVQLGLPVYNNFMIKSQSLMDQKWDLLKNTNRLNRSYEIPKKIGDLDKEELTFKVQVNMDPKILHFIKVDPELTLFHRTKSKADLRNRLKIQCNFNIIIKDLILDFVLVSQDKRDVRRFKAQINVTSQPIFSNITLKTNARTPLIQQIPIQNTTTKDWKINCVISDLQDNQFSLKETELVLQREYNCKKQSKIVCTFIYSPEWVGQSSCKLTITNLITNQQIIYAIKGISEQPLSDDHIYFSTFTGKSGLHSIPIKNPYPQKLTYRVISDLAEINFSPEVTIDANEKLNFNFILAVNNPGIFIGFIKFVDSIGRFFWYSITIEAEDQVIYEQKIKFQTLIEKEVEKVLEFKNSLTKTSSYKVDFDCDYLQGQKTFDVKPYSSYLYRLRFKPTAVINEETTIRIFCPEKGAHIYKVLMISHQHYKRQLPPLKVEVGRVGLQEVKLSEPDQTKNNLKYEVSSLNFYLEYDEPKGNSELLVKICYKPIQEGSQKCTIKLTYGFNLTKMFQIQGIGIAPFTVQTVQFSSIDFKPVLQIIKFKNPYQKAEQKKKNSQKFSVLIQSNQLKVYNFVGYGEQWEAQVNDILAIPVEFRPRQEGYYESMLTVQADHYKWQYLLKGQSINQIDPNYFDEQLICKTRQQGIKVLKMQIPDFLKNQNLKPNRVSIHHSNPEIVAMIRPWLKLKVQMNEIQEQGKSTVYVRFRPQKPINEIITISLFSHLQESVKVNKKIKLFSHPPAPQEKIPIEINSIRKHVFKIPLPMAVIENHQTCSTRMEKGQYFNSRIQLQNISLTFTPNNCTFKTNIYRDLLIVESFQDYWSFQVEIQLVDNIKARKAAKKKQMI